MECNTDSKTGCPDLKDVGLLLLRIFVGFLMMKHGYHKLIHYSEMSQTFPSMLGLSPQLGLSLIIFAEFFCSIAIVLGLFTRLATIPNIIGMAVVVFVAHAGDPLAKRELPVLFLAMFIVILFTGPGKIALDTLIYNKFCPNSRRKTYP